MSKINKTQIRDNIYYSDVVFIDNTDSPYSVLSNTNTIHIDTTTAIVTVDLPAISASNAGRRITLRDKGGNATTNNITLDAAGANTIDGGATFLLDLNNKTVTIESDGISEWAVLSTNQSSGGGGGDLRPDATVSTNFIPAPEHISELVIPSGDLQTSGADATTSTVTWAVVP